MRKRTSQCPQCHSTRVVPIKYGDPTKELMEAARREEIILVPQGWSTAQGGPTLHCLHCSYEWGGEPAPSPDDRSSSAASKTRRSS
jgi:hypothetical protein